MYVSFLHPWQLLLYLSLFEFELAAACKMARVNLLVRVCLSYKSYLPAAGVKYSSWFQV